MNPKNLRYLSIPIILIIIIIVGLIVYDTLNQNYMIIKLYEFNRIEVVIPISKNSILLAGSKFQGNSTIGVAGIYYLNNNSFVQLNLGNAFENGAIYAAAYNGSSILLAGTEYLNSEAVPAVYLYHSGQVINYTSLLSFYRPGRVLAAAWFNNSWFVGGNFLFFQPQGAISIMFLVAIKGNKSIDFSHNISESLNQVPEGEILTLVPSNSNLLIGGYFVIYTAVFILNESTLNVNISTEFYRTVGAIFSATNFKGEWIVGGDYFTPQSSMSNNPYPLPYIAILSNNSVREVNLSYQIGIVTGMASNNKSIAIALRIPFQNLQGITGGTVILYGNTISSLSRLYQSANVSISQLTFLGNRLIGVGYSIVKNNSIGIVLMYKV